MTEEDIKQIESTLKVELPRGYRNLLLSPPSLLVVLMDEFATEHSDYEVPVFLKADVIINENLEVRDPEQGFVFNEEDESAQWPNEYFVIGADCGGNRYCIRPVTGRSNVYEWDHGGRDHFVPTAEPIGQYVETCFKELGELAAMDCDSDATD